MTSRRAARRTTKSTSLTAFLVLAALGAGPVPALGQDSEKANLEIVQVIADAQAFHVNSVLVLGPTEALLIDTQYFLADARRLADQIATTGKRLKAVFITHPDHDHFAGAAAIVERFPETPVYMTSAALEHFESHGVADFERDRSRRPELFADHVVHPQVLPSTHFELDGQAIEILPDLQGDVLAPTNGVVWIPSLRTLIAADLVFSGVHVWLGASDESSRAAWRKDLQRLSDLQPLRVIPGHKPSADTPDAPEAIQTMIDYLADFDALRATTKDGAELSEKMKQKYAWEVERLLDYSAKVAFEQP